MKYKWRIGVSLAIVFIFTVSYLILRPEIEKKSESDEGSRHPRNVKPQPVINETLIKLEKSGEERQKTVDWLVSRYTVDWDYPLESSAWKLADSWLKEREIHPDNPPELGAVLREMATRKIIQSSVGHKGTQLKLSLLLEGGQKVAFKPKWYERNTNLTGTPYVGKDRHNGEIAAYHIQRLLGFNRAPLVVGRVVDLETEIKPVADKKLIDTFYTRNGSTCFYGKCLYCKGEETGVCAKGTSMEGVVILWLSSKYEIKTSRHPWARTYRPDKKAKWEYDDQYCSKVRQYYKGSALLLDFIDGAVFDYIIGNADRHLYDTISQFNHNMMILLDSGKSFGNPNLDEKSILAPLYQCCRIRKSTWDRLQMLKKGVLSDVLKLVLEKEPIAPILVEAHYVAMTRRVTYIIETVEQCMEKFEENDVIVTEKK